MSKEQEVKLVSHASIIERDISKYYHIEKQTDTFVVFGLRPNEFFAAWPTNLEIDDFLKEACSLIDALNAKQVPPRPKVLGNPASIIMIMSPGQVQKATIPPSYSGFGVGWMLIDGENLDPLPLEELTWPLDINDIIQFVEKKGGSVDSDNPDRTFIRIDVEACSIHFNGDRWPRSFSYWSHIYPPDELLKSYERIHSNDVAPEVFSRYLDELITPHLGNRYFRI